LADPMLFHLIGPRTSTKHMCAHGGIFLPLFLFFVVQTSDLIFALYMGKVHKGRVYGNGESQMLCNVHIWLEMWISLHNISSQFLDLEKVLLRLKERLYQGNKSLGNI